MSVSCVVFNFTSVFLKLYEFLLLHFINFQRFFFLITPNEEEGGHLSYIPAWYRISRDLQCTCNVTLRRAFMQQLLQRESNEYYITWVCVCSLRYLPCNARAPYCHLWPVPFYNIFSNYLINGTIFRKQVTEHKMCVLIFCTTFFWNISHSKMNWARYDEKCKLVFI